jgi:hypothetical protein
MATVIDWDYIASVMGSTLAGPKNEERRKYLEDRGFDVRSIVAGLMDELIVVTPSRAEAAMIVGSMMAGMEMAIRVAESKELDDQLEQ